MMALSQIEAFIQLHGSTLFLLFLFPIIILTIQFAFTSIKNVYFHPLSKYPGPKLWAASQIPYCFNLKKGTGVLKLLELHKKYGKVVRITPNDLSWVDGAVWRDAWSHRQGHQEFQKDNNFRTPLPDGTFGILSATRENHQKFRRLLSHAFSDKGMREQQPIIQGYTDLLMDRLRTNANKGSQDMAKWFNWTTFDVIGRLAFGEDFGCLEKEEWHRWVQVVFGNLAAVVISIVFKRLKIVWMLPYLAPQKALDDRRYNFEEASERIDRRIPMGSDVGDFMDNILKHDGEKTGMTRSEMRANASNLVLAGSETTATLLSGTVYQLLQNPDALKKITEEIRGSFESSADIDLLSAGQLKYTLAVLDETMRIYPPVPSQAPRTVPPGGDTIDGQFLPGGTIIHLPQYVANHLESNFTKPLEFHPERFLGAAEFANDNYAVLQPFSAGPRNCIGRNLAYAEMRLILAKLIYNFDMELDEATGDWVDQKTWVLWEKNPLWVKLKPLN